MKLKNVHVAEREPGRYVLAGTTDCFLISFNSYGLNVLDRMLSRKHDIFDEEERFLYGKLKDAGHLEDGSEKITIRRGIEVVSAETTDRCNLTCEHCHLGEKKGDTIPILKLEEIVKDEIALGGYQFDVTGGEPFMDKQIYDKLFLLRDHDLRVTITTNGMIINKKMAQRLKDLGIAEAHVTINGFQEEHERLYGKNTFDLAMRGFRELVDAGLHVIINYCAYPGNMDAIDKFSEYVLGLGALSVDISAIVPMGWARGKKSLFLDEEAYKKFMLNYNGNSACEAKEFSSKGIPCGAATKGVYIQANGDVLPCKMFKTRPIGNIYKSSLIDMYRSPSENFKLITEFDTRNLTNCTSCDTYASCGSGCRARADMDGDVYAPDRLSCVIRK